MKKNLFLILFLVLTLVFSGCSKSEDKTASIKNTVDTSTAAADKLSPKTDSSVSKTEPEKTPLTTADESDTDSFDTEDVKTTEPSYSAEKPSAASDSIKEYTAGSELKMTGSTLHIKEGSSKSDLIGDYSEESEPYGDYSDDDFGTWDVDDSIYVIDKDITLEPAIQPSAGTLTAGEWNDNRNYDFLKKLLADGQNYDYKTFFTNWEISPFNRLVIVTNNASGSPLQGADITVTDGQGNSIWKGVTDHTGTAYAYYGLLDADMMPAKVIAEYSGVSTEYKVQNDDFLDTSVITLTLDAEKKLKTLDLMFTIDTTGSMGDEIYYLQTELQDVIKRVENDTSNIPLRLSINFYRDHGDDYVVRPYEFSTNVNEQLAYLNKEYASGGGDFEEAVEEALEDSISKHAWNDDSIKLLFLVLDAPPHNTEDIRKSLASTIQKASEIGIRIIPVASSGIDKDTEFLLRAFAMTTGGTYTFLTDHSGVGGSHIEPTIGEYEVEHLNDLLVRIIEEYIG